MYSVKNTVLPRNLLYCALGNFSSVPCIHAVPTTPMSDVCAVYDMESRALQIIESTWNELVCWDILYST